jgi:hypothetical protein
MDISNSTDLDTKYRVVGGGGTPIGGHYHPKDFPMEESVSWPTLHAGSRISYTPKSTGPWTVYFVVQGKGLTATLDVSDGQLMLARSGAGFHVQRA